MRRGSGRRAARLLGATALTLDVAAVVVLVLEAARAGLPPIDGNTAGGYALAATFPIVGWIIAERQPRNAIGWIFIVIGLSQALATFADVYSTYGLVTGAAAPPFAAELAWAGTWSWAPGYILLLTLSVLLFPDGRLPSRRWRPVVWATLAALVLVVVPTAVAVWPIRSPELAAGRVPSSSLATVAFDLQAVGLAVATVAAVASVAGLVVRFRRSRGVERRQLQWFAFAGAVEVIAIAVTPFLDFGTATGPINALLAVAVAPLLPVAAAVAILRYRLYEIDRIISRTISYAIVTALLTGAYGVAFVALEALLAPVTTNGGPVAVATSTLVVFVLFSPARRRISAVVDRRFDRSRYDAEQTVASLVERLRDETDLRALGDEVESTVRSALSPAVVVLWTRAE